MKDGQGPEGDIETWEVVEDVEPPPGLADSDSDGEDAGTSKTRIEHPIAELEDRLRRRRESTPFWLKTTAEVGAQTEITLPHTQKDVMWTPSCLEPRVEYDEGGDDTTIGNEDHIEAETDDVSEVDSIECEEEEEEAAERAQYAKETGVQDVVIMMSAILYFMYSAIMVILCRVKTEKKDDECDENINALADDMDVDVKRKDPRRMTKVRMLKLKRGITVDSGAGHNVMPRSMVRNKNKIRPSKGSLKGAHYVAANDGRIPNEGEHDFEFFTSEGNEECMTFQIAAVNKALGAVPYIVDAKYRVVFDQDDAGRDQSYMKHKPTGRVTRFRRERNVWILDAFTKVDESFHRQG